MIEKTQAFTPYIVSYLAANAENTNGNPFTADYNGLYTSKFEKNAWKPNRIPDRSQFSNEFQKLHKNLEEKVEKEERWKTKLKQQVASEVVIVSDKDQQFVQSVCDYLSQLYNVPEKVWPNCRIAGTWVPNAWAYPGGNVFISAGLLGILSDLDSLMLVLGHEIGHVIGRHTSRQVVGQNTLNYTANAISLASSATSLSGGLGLYGQVTWINWFPKMFASSVTITPLSNAATQLAFLAPISGLMAQSRGLEWEADRLGHQVALAAGAKNVEIYKGWNEFLTFVETHFNVNETLKQKIMSDHPNGRKRLEKISTRERDYADQFQIENQENRLSKDIYQAYSAMHLRLKPQVDAWGKKVKAEADAKKSKKLQNTLTSFLLPSHQCMKHALGAAAE